MRNLVSHPISSLGKLQNAFSCKGCAAFLHRKVRQSLGPAVTSRPGGGKNKKSRPAGRDLQGKALQNAPLYILTLARFSVCNYSWYGIYTYKGFGLLLWGYTLTAKHNAPVLCLTICHVYHSLLPWRVAIGRAANMCELIPQPGQCLCIIGLILVP